MMRRLVAALSVAAATALSTQTAFADPTVSICIEANESSIKLRTEHHLQSARKDLLICAAASCPSEIRVECVRRLDDLDAAMPTIVFDAKDAQGNDLVAISITMDGAKLSEKADGTALKIDPGPHQFVFKAEQEEIVRTIVLREAEKDRHERLVFKTIGTAQPSLAHRDPVRRAVGVAVAAVGLVAVGVGAGLGARAGALWSNSQNECADKTNCKDHDAAVSDHDAATAMALGSTIAFIGGGIAVVAGGVLFFTAPYVSPAKGGSAGLTIGGRF